MERKTAVQKFVDAVNETCDGGNFGTRWSDREVEAFVDAALEYVSEYENGTADELPGISAEMVADVLADLHRFMTLSS